jgi:hypothetical protein
MDPIDQQEKGMKQKAVKIPPPEVKMAQVGPSVSQKRLKIHSVHTAQPMQLPNDQGNPQGAPMTAFLSKDCFMEPHPIGIRMKRKESDTFGAIIGSANIKYVYFKEE